MIQSQRRNLETGSGFTLLAPANGDNLPWSVPVAQSRNQSPTSLAVKFLQEEESRSRQPESSPAVKALMASEEWASSDKAKLGSQPPASHPQGLQSATLSPAPCFQKPLGWSDPVERLWAGVVSRALFWLSWPSGCCQRGPSVGALWPRSPCLSSVPRARNSPKVSTLRSKPVQAAPCLSELMG